MASLYVSPHPDDFRSLLALIAAEFCPSPRPQIITEDPPASLNARSRPALALGAAEGGAVLSGASAVSWYLASQGKRAGVDAKQQSQVWQWLSFADNEVTPVSCAVVFPLMGLMGMDKKVRGQGESPHGSNSFRDDIILRGSELTLGYVMISFLSGFILG